MKKYSTAQDFSRTLLKSIANELKSHVTTEDFEDIIDSLKKD